MEWTIAHVPISQGGFCVWQVSPCRLQSVSCGPIDGVRHVGGNWGADYTSSDYVRADLPIGILMWIVVSLLIPVFWPFRDKERLCSRRGNTHESDDQ